VLEGPVDVFFVSLRCLTASVAEPCEACDKQLKA